MHQHAFFFTVKAPAQTPISELPTAEAVWENEGGRVPIPNRRLTGFNARHSAVVAGNESKDSEVTSLGGHGRRSSTLPQPEQR